VGKKLLTPIFVHDPVPPKQQTKYLNVRKKLITVHYAVKRQDFLEENFAQIVIL